MMRRTRIFGENQEVINRGGSCHTELFVHIVRKERYGNSGD